MLLVGDVSDQVALVVRLDLEHVMACLPLEPLAGAEGVIDVAPLTRP